MSFREQDLERKFNKLKIRFIPFENGMREMAKRLNIPEEEVELLLIEAFKSKNEGITGLFDDLILQAKLNHPETVIAKRKEQAELRRYHEKRAQQEAEDREKELNLIKEAENKITVAIDAKKEILTKNTTDCEVILNRLFRQFKEFNDISSISEEEYHLILNLKNVRILRKGFMKPKMQIQWHQKHKDEYIKSTMEFLIKKGILPKLGDVEIQEARDNLKALHKQIEKSRYGFRHGVWMF